jgi:hypothetical protein
MKPKPKPGGTPGSNPATPEVLSRNAQLNSAQVGSTQMPEVKWGDVDLPIIASGLGIDITKPYDAGDVFDALRARKVPANEISAMVQDGNKALEWMKANPDKTVQITTNTDPNRPATPANASRKSPSTNANATTAAAGAINPNRTQINADEVDAALAEGDARMAEDGDVEVEAEDGSKRRMSHEEAREFLSNAGVHGQPKTLTFSGGGVKYSMTYRRPNEPVAGATTEAPATRTRKGKAGKDEPPKVDPNWRQKQDDAVRQKYEERGQNAPFFATLPNKIQRNMPSIKTGAAILGGAAALGAGYGAANYFLGSPSPQPQQRPGYDADAARERELLDRENAELGIGRPQNQAGTEPLGTQNFNRIQQSRNY